MKLSIFIVLLFAGACNADPTTYKRIGQSAQCTTEVDIPSISFNLQENLPKDATPGASYKKGIVSAIIHMVCDNAREFYTMQIDIKNNRYSVVRVKTTDLSGKLIKEYDTDVIWVRGNEMPGFDLLLATIHEKLGKEYMSEWAIIEKP